MRQRLREIDQEDWTNIFVVHSHKEGECQIWEGKMEGQIPCYFGYRVPKLVWEKNNGAVPQGKRVMRKCKNPRCIAPEHLELTDGGAYRVVVPMLRGTENANAKLTEDDVRNIRKRYKEGETQASIAADYNVDKTTVGAITRRKNWSWLE